MQIMNDLLDKLATVDPLVWATLAAYFAPYAQELLNKVRDFGRSSNYLLGLVVIPGAIAVATSLQSPEALNGVHPAVASILTATLAAVVSQLKYGLSLKPRLDQKKELSELRTLSASISEPLPVHQTVSEY